MPLTLDQFEYHLPMQLIAKTPAVPRDASRLLVLERATGQVTHAHFYNLADQLQSGDVLVRNNTKVIPARIFGHKSTGGKVEVLLNKLVSQTDTTCTWEVLTKPGLKTGQHIFFGEESSLMAECTGANPKILTRLLTFACTYSQLLAQLSKLGHTPLPPYISDYPAVGDKLSEQYQTLYARTPGSSAAPTAGLHFTEELDAKLREKGVRIEEITLHVGLGTFLPVKENEVTKHHMHSEWFELSADVAQRLNRAKKNGQRIIAVGTTTTRVLETCANEAGQLQPQLGDTDIFIYPPYKFKFVDGLITNFHLPKSTLLMLVAALVSRPNEIKKFTGFKESTVGKAYREAIKNKYRFYSFGDGMLII